MEKTTRLIWLLAGVVITLWSLIFVLFGLESNTLSFFAIIIGGSLAFLAINGLGNEDTFICGAALLVLAYVSDKNLFLFAIEFFGQ